MSWICCGMRASSRTGPAARRDGGGIEGFGMLEGLDFNGGKHRAIEHLLHAGNSLRDGRRNRERVEERNEGNSHTSCPLRSRGKMQANRFVFFPHLIF
jgi:hypothetical protein